MNEDFTSGTELMTSLRSSIVSGKLEATMMLKDAKPAQYKHTKYCHCKKAQCIQRCSLSKWKVIVIHKQQTTAKIKQSLSISQFYGLC